MQMYPKPTFMRATYTVASTVQDQQALQQQQLYRAQSTSSPAHMIGAYHYAKPPSPSIRTVDQYSEHSTSCGSENSDEYFRESSSYSPPGHSMQQQQQHHHQQQLQQQQSQYKPKGKSNQNNNNNNINNFNSNYTSNSINNSQTNNNLSNNNNTSSNNNNNNNNQSSMIPEEAKYKTEMCKNWVETGKCNYAEKCKFAHGKAELNQKMAANKHFKTKRCKQFFETGICHYGPRCHFLHDTRSTPSICVSQFYTKKIAFPELFIESSVSAAAAAATTPIRFTQPLQTAQKRLEIFERITSASNNNFQTPQSL